MRLHIGRFAVAAFAGICAVFGPRLISLLATSNPTEEIVLFGGSYLTTGAIVSIMIGAGIVVIKWNVPNATPSEIFGAALAFPAVISGGLNMSAGVIELGEAQKAVIEANNVVYENSPIQRRESQGIHRLNSESSELIEPREVEFSFSIVSTARAQDGPSGATLMARPDSFDPSRLVSQQQYFIFLDEFDTAGDAINAVGQLRSIAPDSFAVESGGKYYVLEDSDTRALTQATIDALELLDRLPDGYDPNVAPGIIQAPSQ